MTALLAALLAAALPAAAQDDDGTSYPALIPVGNLVLFYSSVGPLNFETMGPRDLPPGAKILPGEVTGTSCQHALNVPISATFRSTSISAAQGDGGYRKAVEAIRRAHPDLAGIFDVKVDMHTISILGVFRRQCTEVSARGFR